MRHLSYFYEYAAVSIKKKLLFGDLLAECMEFTTRLVAIFAKRATDAFCNEVVGFLAPE
ncbi:MAG: hypothetical protein JO025_13460 [Verrucomicrobia bacterium]|nr:hypothetical protein [Verrucomicrobiota bacterium]